jgi:hypothetical protein
MLRSPLSETVIDHFCEGIQSAPLTGSVTNEEWLLILVSFYVLVLGLAGDYAFDPGRFDPHIKRFATARFEFDVLLANFQKGFADMMISIGFTVVLKRLPSGK